LELRLEQSVLRRQHIQGKNCGLPPNGWHPTPMLVGPPRWRASPIDYACRGIERVFTGDL
jgi:hypothetical protein